MSDRILRDEIWQSDRFLDLPTDTAKLAFTRFLNLADDFGNFEGGLRRLHRILHECTQVKNVEATASAIDAMMAVDLVRRYEVDEREFFHIPRFRSHRQYLSRRYPKSPWCNAQIELGKHKRYKNQRLGKNVVATSHTRSSVVAEGVGVGVGVKKDICASDDARFCRFWSSYPNKKAKVNAKKAFAKINPGDDLLSKMLSSLETQKSSQAWKKDGGQFIPMPATWLNGRRWEDEMSTAANEATPWDNAK